MNADIHRMIRGDTHRVIRAVMPLLTGLSGRGLVSSGVEWVLLGGIAELTAEYCSVM